MANDLTGVTLIFDLDGTVVDTADDLAASMNHALACAGHPPTPSDEVRHLVGHGARRMLSLGFERSSGAIADDAALDEGLAHFLNHYENNIAVHSHPFPGVVEFMERFAGEGASLAICTNKREHLAVRLLDELGLARYFAVIVGSDTTSAAKPDPAPVRLCLEATQATRAVFLGDSDTDIKAAQSMALPCLVASFGYGPLLLAGDAAGVFDNYAAAGDLAYALLGDA